MYIPGRGRGFRCCDRGKRCNCVAGDRGRHAGVQATPRDALAPDDADLAKLHISDLYLAFACSRGHAGALAALETSYLRELTGPLRKMGFDSAAIDETLRSCATSCSSHRRQDPEHLGLQRSRCAQGLAALGRGTHRAPRSQATRTPRRVRRGVAHVSDDDSSFAYMKKTYGARSSARARRRSPLAVEDRLLSSKRFGHRLGVVELASLWRQRRHDLAARRRPCESGSSRPPVNGMTEELEVARGPREHLALDRSQLADLVSPS